jgi:TusA-related sulfurtransferase
MVDEKEPKHDRTLDCTGLFCPVPVFQTRQELDKMGKCQILEILADDPAAEGDIPSLARRLNIKILKIDKQKDILRFLLQK